MKNKCLFLFLLIFLTLITSIEAQMQLPDEKDLNPVYLEELCSKLNESKDYLLIDVRSAGEYSDTSQFSGLNLGRFKNSVNIDVNELESRLPEIQDHKNKPVFVYCSHSNRSRVASRILKNAGFSNVYNVNGGISEYLFDNIICPEGIYTNSLSYKLYSPESFKELLKNRNTFILDIRSPAEFNGADTSEYKNIGRLNGSVNIPFNELESRLKEIPKYKKVLIYDFDNSISPKAAALLVNNGYDDTGILLFGLYSWIYKFGSLDTDISGKPVYTISDYLSTLKLITDEKTILLDIRTRDDYNNKNKMEHLNFGHFKRSINIPADEIETRINELNGYKDKKILVYGNFKESKAPDVCKYLVKNGFKNVINASSGYYKFIWNKRNIKNYKLPDEMIENP